MKKGSWEKGIYLAPDASKHLAIWPGTVKIGEKGHPICLLSSAEEINEEDEKHADMIAAAPELLAALKFCLSVIEDQGVFDASEKIAVKKALAAIAKATGQEDGQI